jgi:tetratricopeptide (TPR) repeat protein
MSTGDGKGARRPTAGEAKFESVVKLVREFKAAGRGVDAKELLDRFVENWTSLNTRGESGSARRLLDRVIANSRQYPADLHDLGCLFAERSDDEAAEPLLRAAWEAMPRQPQVMRNLAQVLMRRGDLASAQGLAREQLARRPGDTFALALAAIVAMECGDAAEARRLIDFERLVRVSRLPPPPGYRTVEKFNQALSEAVLNQVDLKHDPADRTTRGGRQSGALFPAKTGPLAALQTSIARAVKDYATALPPDPEHPFLAQRPANLRLHGWATVLDSGGYQQPHIHPGGWLSGVYYPRLPRSERTRRAAGQAG